MKFKYLLSLCVAGAALAASAQTHVEGVEYYKADQYGNALQLLERNFNNPGTDKAIANYYLGLLALKDNNTAKAKSYFDAGIQENPNYAYNYVGLASIDLANGRTKEAEANIKLAEKHAQKKDAALKVAIARAYYEAPKTIDYSKKITQYLEKARKDNMTEPEIFIFEGDRYYDANDANNAGTNYEMATTYNPQSAEAYVKYAKLFQKVNPEFSVQMLKKLLQNNPNSALGQRELAKIYDQMQRYSDAVEQYGKYVENPNHFAEDENYYALLLFSKGDYQKGYDYATSLLKKDADNFTARLYQFRNAAQIQSMKDQWAPMAEEIWAYHVKDPKKYSLAPIDYQYIVEELVKAKKTDEAREVLNAAMADFPKMPTFVKQLAFTYLEQDDYAKTAEAYSKYLSMEEKPSNSELTQGALFCYLVGLEDIDKNPAEATKMLNQAIEYCNQAIAADASAYRPYKVKGDAKVLLNPANASTVASADYTQGVQAIDKAGLTDRNVKDYNAMRKYLGQPEVAAPSK